MKTINELIREMNILEKEISMLENFQTSIGLTSNHTTLNNEIAALMKTRHTRRTEINLMFEAKI